MNWLTNFIKPKFSALVKRRDVPENLWNNCPSCANMIHHKELNENLSSWQRMIGYVPQNVSILDESILFNISLESEPDKINIEKINETLRTVDLYDHIYSLPKNLYTIGLKILNQHLIQIFFKNFLSILPKIYYCSK